MADDFISEDEVVSSPRGRKTQLDPNLVSIFKKLKPGQAVRLGDTFGEVPKEKRATVSSILRKNFRAARDDEPSIRYTPQGIPQVSVRKMR